MHSQHATATGGHTEADAQRALPKRRPNGPKAMPNVSNPTPAADMVRAAEAIAIWARSTPAEFSQDNPRSDI